MALEPRLRVGILIEGGFWVLGNADPAPEVDPLNFASRVTAPMLMLNGRYDALFPYEISQRPMFLALGTPDEDKRHALFPAGHGVALWGWKNEVARESLDWLDRYFGEPTPLDSPRSGD